MRTMLPLTRMKVQNAHGQAYRAYSGQTKALADAISTLFDFYEGDYPKEVKDKAHLSLVVIYDQLS